MELQASVRFITATPPARLPKVKKEVPKEALEKMGADMLTFKNQRA